uniref:Uncharacterized protein LOC111132076 n=1 Tax=Crassostrea virginica TaxID=6565 RepID=A0A8B8E5H5_CRAVI|nr:uncharacterized protein LOC111132076 [Crassostrea virginica]
MMGKNKKHRSRKDRAQDVLRCDVCSEIEWEKSPAEVHCSTCHTNVCGPCVAKHMASNNSKKHDIVLLHSTNAEVDLPNCPSHSTVKCELFCKQCIVPICLKCLSSNHNCHPVEEITELCVAIRADIQKNTEKLKTELIPKFEKLAASEEGKAKQLTQAYEIFESSIEDHGKKIHKTVDAVITKYKAKAQLMSQTDAQILQQQREDINRLLSETKQEAAKNELLERSRNVTELLAYKEKPRNAPILKNIIPPVFNTTVFPDDLIESLIFGDFPNSQVVVAQETPSWKTKNNQLVSIDVTCCIHQTQYKQLYRIASTKLLELWTIGSENLIRLINTMNGSIVKSITTPMNLIDICSNDSENLYVCNDKTIYKKDSGLNFKRCFSAPDGWSFKALAISRVTIPETDLTDGIPLNLLMVLTEDTRQCKVVCLANSLSPMREFQYDRNGMNLFNSNRSDFYLAENRNGDICVSDTTVLVVIDERGNFRSRYHGQSTLRKLFTPRGVTTDHRGNILLADFGNRCIHLLDRNVYFVRYITCDGSLDRIIDVSCDDNGGVLVAERDTVKIKYIRYQ